MTRRRLVLNTCTYLGHSKATACSAETKFSVNGHRVCRAHVGHAVEASVMVVSGPGVAVYPDYADEDGMFVDTDGQPS